MLSIFLLSVATLVVFFLVIMAAVDMASRIEYVESHWPRAVRWTKHRAWYSPLLLLAVLLLIVNWWELEQSVRAAEPNLVGVLNQFILGDDPDEKDGKGCQFFLDIAVKNLGTPSIASDWRLNMDNPAISGIGPVFIPENYTIKDKDQKDYAIFHANMRAEERLMKIPIQQGTYGGGWLRFVVKGATPEECRRANKVLYFKDITDRPYSIKFDANMQQNKPVLDPTAGDSPYVSGR